MTTIGFLGAFLGGVLSVLSPCSALLLPAFFAYAFTSKRQLVSKTAVFFLGLAVILVPIGAAAGTFGALVTQHRSTVITIGGAVLIFLGVYTFLGFGFNIPGLNKLSSSSKVSGAGWVPVFLLGCVYGFAGFCAGPLLGAVLTTAVVGGSVLSGALVMAFYAFGMTVPLFVLALLWDRFQLGEKQWLRGRTKRVGPFKFSTFSMIAGALFVVIGVLFLTTYGTSSLPSLVSTESNFAIQEWIAEKSALIPNAVLLLIIAFGVEVGLGLKLLTTPYYVAEPAERK